MPEKNVETEDFSHLLVSDWKLEALSRLVDKPQYSYTIRELAKKTSGSYDSVRDLVHKLGDKDVVEMEKKGSSFLVNYNRDNRNHSLIRQLLRTESGRLLARAKTYAEKFYQRKQAETKAIILYGSVARGSATAESDIDVLIVTEATVDREEVEDEARKLAARVGHERSVNIVPLVESYKEFKDNLAREERFEVNIDREGELLEGEL